MDALKCEFKNSSTSVKDSPIRMLIKTMPDLAKRVFDKCMESNLQKHSETAGKKVRATVARNARIRNMKMCTTMHILGRFRNGVSRRSSISNNVQL